MKKAMIECGQNFKNDELYTPQYAIYPLLKYIPRGKTIWECTDYGNSNITKVLKKEGYKVVETTKDSFNFLTDTPNFNFDIIITNPPYSLKDEFISRCYGYCKPFALLLPITTLEGVERGKMFAKNGLELLVFDRRINFSGGAKGCWFNTSWFCWHLLPKELMFASLKPKKENRQMNMLEIERKQLSIFDCEVVNNALRDIENRL